MQIEPGELSIVPLTPERWADFEDLFGSRGACGGCWCMYWRLKRGEMELQKGEGNRFAMRHLVENGAAPGLLAYQAGNALGWVAVAPREDYPTLERSRILARLDDSPVWSVTCFFVRRGHRRKGLTLALIKAAVEFASSRGAEIIEGYPVEPKKGDAPDVFVYTGLASTFLKAGFVEAGRRSETRPIMRYSIKDGK